MSDNLISIVIPVFEEHNIIENSIGRIREILLKNGINHEIVVVDDGSKDSTWEILCNLAETVSNIRAIRLSRNFGKEAALCAGLESARGQACIVMDADLQHPPELIPEMVRLWREEGYDVIDGIKSHRGNESFFSRISANGFYFLLKKLSGIDLKSASDFKLLDARVVEAWKQMREYNTFFRGMSEWVGFRRKTLPYRVAQRAGGSTKWSKIGLFKLAVNAITSYSSLPLYLVTLMGVVFLAGAFVLGIQTLYNKFRGIAVSGFTTVILLILITGSALMISLGIIGTYIAKIYDEVKSRPRYIITEIRENKGGF